MRPIVYVNAKRCRTCDRCLARTACKTRAIVQIDAGELPAVEPSRCRGCRSCVGACPFGAIAGEGSAEPDAPKD